MPKRLLLIRHGEVETPKEGCFLGSSDAPLTSLGRRQAASLGARIGVERGTRCFASPVSRALETARLASEQTGFHVEVDSDLREIDFGLWEGMTFGEIQAANPDAVNQWAQYGKNFRFPEGESIGEFLGRVHSAAERIAHDEAKTIMVFTHGGVIRALICYYLGLDPRNYLLFEVRPASVTTLRLFDGEGKGKGILAGLNDVCHLEEI